MKSLSTRYLDLLERRLALLDSLAKELAASRGDFISMDLERIERSIGEQVRFCAQIRSLDAGISDVQMRCAQGAGARPRTNAISWPGLPGEDAEQQERIRATMVRLAAAQAELKRLNDAHLVLLRRSRHTVHILLNLFQSHAPTYSAPPTLPAGALCEERV